MSGPEAKLQRAIIVAKDASDAEVLRDALDACPWPAPWVARRFEIDCPCYGDGCVGGEGCEVHDVDEIEAPEAYPGGQVVAQIDVPGLERFAKPTAHAIATMRNTLARAHIIDGAKLRALAERWEGLNVALDGIDCADELRAVLEGDE